LDPTDPVKQTVGQVLPLNKHAYKAKLVQHSASPEPKGLALLEKLALPSFPRSLA